MSAQTNAPVVLEPGLNLVIHASRSFEVIDLDVWANNRHYGPCQYWPHTDAELDAQAAFYASHNVIDCRIGGVP